MTAVENLSIYRSRQAKLSTHQQTNQFDAVILNPGASLFYLTGVHFHAWERPVVAIFTPDKPLAFILPMLEVGKITGLPYPAQGFPYGEDPETWPDVFREACLASGLKDNSKVGIEPLLLRVFEYRYLQGALPQAQFLSAQETIAKLRLYKDGNEIAAMRNAIDVAQKALEATLLQTEIGMSERQIAAELTVQLFRNGCDPQLPFEPIVASGPNSANPHAVPTDRPLEKGDLLIIDWGARVDGYISDLTRTFAISELSPDWTRLGEIVEQANVAGRASARPGVSAGEVDRVTRAVIDDASYGQFFIHRTGHGIGLEAHEEPYIRDGNPLPLEEGMSFTIEPGIYLPGKGGIRIEDNLVINAEGAETLSSLERSIRVLG